VVRGVLVSAGVGCVVLGGVSGVAFGVGLGDMTVPATVVVAMTAAGFLTAGVVLVARAHSHRPESPPVVLVSGGDSGVPARDDAARLAT